MAKAQQRWKSIPHQLASIVLGLCACICVLVSVLVLQQWMELSSVFHTCRQALARSTSLWLALETHQHVKQDLLQNSVCQLDHTAVRWSCRWRQSLSSKMGKCVNRRRSVIYIAFNCSVIFDN